LTGRFVVDDTSSDFEIPHVRTGDANVDDGSCEYAMEMFDIVINEIFYNGNDDVGYPDSTHEFFELYNNDKSTVDVSLLYSSKNS
jgi:hypothetical protein